MNDFFEGAWVFIRRHGEGVTCGEITGRDPVHQWLVWVWVTDGGDPVRVSLSQRGQAVLRAAAPAWAVHAVDTNGEG